MKKSPSSSKFKQGFERKFSNKYMDPLKQVLQIDLSGKNFSKSFVGPPKMLPKWYTDAFKKSGFRGTIEQFQQAYNLGYAYKFRSM